MNRALVLLVVVACQTETGDDTFPISPGGGNGTPGTGGKGLGDGGTDADDGDAGTVIAGRVCVLGLDLRALSTCANTGADKITVTLGSKSTTTTADGSFTMEASLGTPVVWRAFDSPPTPPGTNFVTSVIPFSTTNVIPIVTTTNYTNFLSTNGVLAQQNEGAIVVRVVKANAPLLGATVTVAPVSRDLPFYDGALAASWDRDQTGTLGLVWIHGAAVGNNIIKVIQLGLPNFLSTHVVEDQAITFGTIEVP
jgi:hypothetical protein